VFHVKHEGWQEAAGRLGLNLDQEQTALLSHFAELLREHAVPYGFIAASDVERLEERHLVDSLRAAALVRPSDTTAYDLGSGAGLPGIPVAIACPWVSLRLVDSRRTRAAFLELAVQRLSLQQASVIHGRIERLTDRVAVCFARALASPAASWAAAEPLLVPDGRLIYFAGERFDAATLPPGVRTEAVPASALARSGPLVIMTRT
jgi:16S rRNA (guanine527-N7)-methyltransferase